MNLQEKLNKIDKQRTQLLKDVWPEITKNIFDILSECPSIKTFGVPQYTLGFNDGEPTYYTVYAERDCCQLNGEQIYSYNRSEHEYLELSDLEQQTIDKVLEYIDTVIPEVFQNNVEEGLMIFNTGNETVEHDWIDHD